MLREGEPELRDRGERIGDERHRRFEHVDFEPAAAARAFAFEERGQNAGTRIHAGDVVGNRGTGDVGVGGIDEQAAHTAQGLRHGIECRPVPIRTGCSEAGDRTVDQARKTFVQLGRIETDAR